MHVHVKFLYACYIPYNVLDGQKIAKKLCLQIKKETKSIKSLLKEYQSCQAISAGPGGSSSGSELTCSFDEASIIEAKLQSAEYCMYVQLLQETTDK